jgi:aspartyl-tRNA(Asn)/glutamyl-tRNA(Gln) amidotransferase subunit B
MTLRPGKDTWTGSEDSQSESKGEHNVFERNITTGLMASIQQQGFWQASEPPLSILILKVHILSASTSSVTSLSSTYRRSRSNLWRHRIEAGKKTESFLSAVAKDKQFTHGWLCDYRGCWRHRRGSEVSTDRPQLLGAIKLQSSYLPYTMFTHNTRNAVAVVSKRPYICQACLRRAQSPPLSLSLWTPHTSLRGLQTDGPAKTPGGTPFRKALKDAAKEQKKNKRDGSELVPNSSNDPRLEKWELTVGIEIHAELNTARKLFSGAATSISEAPNSHVSLFDVAFPGSQPHFQKETLIPALRGALALNCTIQRKSSFDRKHYFYQDQPAGYQITQYYEPFARDGHIILHSHDFPPGTAPADCPITIGIKQVQMEQDTAKTVQQPPSTHLLDFNRVSHPLIEIITLPQIHDPTVAAACVRKIQTILKTVNACTTGMEMGGLRADVNVSIRERSGQIPEGAHSYHGVTGLGQRTEIKNLASLKAVEEAIIAERDRQIDLLESGGAVEGETRGWTLGSKTTKRLRGKEGEIDYRYMPDPDIAPVLLGDVCVPVPTNVALLT